MSTIPGGSSNRDAAGQPATLSATTRLLTRVTAALLLVLGVPMFVASGWASEHMLWNVPPLATMTMGAWYLAGAWTAWEAARVWRWPVVYPALILLWVFTILEVVVLGIHADRLRLDAAFGIPYLAAAVLAALASTVGVVDWLRTRPRRRSVGIAVPGAIRVIAAVFFIEAAIIAVASFVAPGKPEGFVFAEALSPFTLKAFGAFYLAVVLGVSPLVLEGSLVPVLFYARVAVLYVVTIMVAAAAYLGSWDLAGRPSQIAYWGTYAVFGILAAAYVWRYRAYSREAEPAA